MEVVVLWFPIARDTTDADASQTARAVAEGIPGWIDRLVTAIEILTHQNLDRASFSTIAAHDTILFLARTGAPSLTRLDSSDIHITMTVPSDDTVLRREHWKSALRAASKRYTPRLEHVILRDARHARARGEFRRAVIDAGTAAELALSTASERHLQRALGTAAWDKLLETFRALGGRLRLAEILKVKLPDRNLREELVDPRNRAIHRGASLSRSEANAAIDAASALVGLLVPREFDKRSQIP